MSSVELAGALEDIGARGFHTHQREFTTHGFQSFKGDVPRTVQLLGDIICNPAFSSEDLAIVKENTADIHEANPKELKRTLMENVHFNAYREHMMG